MYAVAAGLLGDLYQRLGIEVGGDRILGRAVAEFTGLRGQPGVQRQGVHRRVHANRLHAEGGRGLGDANGDLATVADEDPLERLG